jgi:hypothetical protein
MKKLLTLTSAIAAVLLAGGTLSAFAQASVGVNFVPSSGGGVDNGSTDSLASAESAGVPGYAQTNWNNLSNQGIGVTLNDSTGSATALTIAWASGNTPVSFGVGGLGSDGKLMDGAINGIGNITNYTTLSGYTDVASMPGGAKPMVYVGGLQAWLHAQGATGYTIVIYQNDYTAYGTDLMWVESVSGSPTNNTMLAGPDLTPTLWTGRCCGFSGTYSQISATATNYSSRAYNANYGIFTGLTNDAVLIRAGTADYQQGSINGFQIIPIFPTSVGVKFVSANGSGAYGWGVGVSSPDTLAPTDSAGVPGFAQVNWNNLGRWGDSAGSWAGPAVVLTNSAGSATSLSIQWSSDFTASSGSSDSTPNGRLMDGYIGSYNQGGASPLGNSVYNSSDNNYPLAYVGGLQAWYRAQGAVGYKIVLYVGGGPGWQIGQGYVESVTGNPLSNTMVEGSILSPPLWAQVGATYSGTFTHITSTNSGSPTFGSGYMVFNGLTNDAVLLRTSTNSLGLNGFQIIPIFATSATIGVHFVDSGNPGLQNSAPDALSPAASAGAPGYAQTNWNNFGPTGDSVGNNTWATGPAVVLNDGSGSPTSLQISWANAGNGATGTTNLSTPNGNLMDGFLSSYDGSTPTNMVNNGPVYFSPNANQRPLASIGGLSSWLAGYPGAVGYSVVLYYSAAVGGPNVEGYVNAATGDIVSGTLTEVGPAAPPVFGQAGTFAGTFVQATSTNSGSPTAGANYMVFTGLTNDTIVIHEHMLGWLGALNGFQIVPIFGAAPTVSTNAYLTSLAFSPSSGFAPAFTSNMLSGYNETNAYTDTPTVTVTNADPTATNTLTVNGVNLGILSNSVASAPLTLGVGSTNVVQVQVVSQDLSVTNLYVVDVTVLPPPASSDASLSYLALSPLGALTPNFNTTLTNYVATNANANTSVTVTVTNTSAFATNVLFYNGAPQATNAGSLTASVPLVVGSGNVIVVVVTAQDGVTTSTNTVDVTRLASSNALLSNLVITQPGTLYPTPFSSGTTSYNATNTYLNKSVTVTATSADGTAALALTFNGTPAGSLTSATPSGNQTLVLPTNTVVVTVVSQDLSQTNTYTVDVLLQPSQTVAKLTNSVSGNNLVLSWPADHLGYRLLTQTNNLNKGVSGNINDWGTVAGSQSITSTNIAIIKAGVTNAYYKLVYP